MRTSCKIIKYAVVILLSIVLTASVFSIIASYLIPPDAEKMEKYFQRDKDDLRIVAEFLMNSDYSLVNIDKITIANNEMFTGAYTRYQKIDDDVVVKSIKRILKNKKYNSIQKYDDTIFFKKWLFVEQERGIGFTTSIEENLSSIPYLVRSSALSESNWYYCESDYEEFRIINPNTPMNITQGTVSVRV